MIIIGIDPGISGAMAAYDTKLEKFIWLEDMPTIASGTSGKKMINPFALRESIDIVSKELKHGSDHIEVIIEQVSAMPGNGVTAMFNFGRSFGIIEGVICAMKLPLHMVRPATWKKSMGYTNDKEVIRADMVRHFPYFADLLKRKLDADRAEAMALCLYHRKRVNADRNALEAYNAELLKDE